MATTTNFGWETPDDTDLVKDGALAMRTLGNAIDTSMADLKGGTTGQVLSKNSNTDMDFVWVTSDDANAIQNAIVDAKGDLISASAADTPARLAVGNNGENLVADSSTSTGLRWQGNFSAGKNCIINGDFRINQRNVTSTTSNTDYVFDRFRLGRGGGGTVTFSSQAFTAGTAPVAGYEAVNFARLVTVSQSANADYAAIRYAAEDVRTYAGSTITLSVWAKGASGGEKFNFALEQVFGSGGSSAVITKTAVQTITNTWARYSVTVAVPSISGKTIGTGSALMIWLFTSGGSSLSSYTDIGNQNATVDFWGLQAEIGNTATAFQTATGTLAGELAACQRYFYRAINGADNSAEQLATCQAFSTTQTIGTFRFPVVMRTAASATVSSAGHFLNYNASLIGVSCTVFAIDTLTARDCRLVTTVSSGLVAGNASHLIANSASATLDFSAEL